MGFPTIAKIHLPKRKLGHRNCWMKSRMSRVAEDGMGVEMHQYKILKNPRKL